MSAGESKSVEKAGEMKVCYISHGLGGVACSAEPLEAHVKDGKLVRIRPVHFKNVRLYEIKAKGKTFTQPPKSLPYWISLAYKKRAYSPNRVLSPLKRADWSPDNPIRRIGAKAHS